MKLGKFINLTGKKRYLRENDIGNVIRYIIRQRSNEKDIKELVSWGGFGIPEWREAEGIIEAFKEVQKLHTRNGKFGRYIDHEFYSFTDDEVVSIKESNADMDSIAREMASDFYQDGTQVVYALHEKEKENGKVNLHVNFAVNTVDYRTGKKRRENMTDTGERSIRMNEIVERHIKEAFRTKRLP